MSDRPVASALAASAPGDRVVDINRHRIRRLEAEMAATRRRLEKLERKRLRAAVKMGLLQRKLACCDRKLAALRERLARQKDDARPTGRQ